MSPYISAGDRLLATRLRLQQTSSCIKEELKSHRS
jgi:hypothetical protein